MAKTRTITRARRKTKPGRIAAIAVAVLFVSLCAASYLLRDNAGRNIPERPLATAPKADGAGRPRVAFPAEEANGAPIGDSIPAIQPSTAASGGYDPDSNALKTLLPSLRFAERVNSFLNSPAREVERQGRHFLKSKNAEDRALGGVLIFLSKALDRKSAEAIAADKDPLVALTVLDWVRDMGSNDEIQMFSRAVDGRGFSDAGLLSYIEKSGEKVGGGRSALDILLQRQDEETVAEAIGPVILAKGASIDVREQAMFKILEPENCPYGKALVQRLASEEGADPVFAAMVAKWQAFSELPPPSDDDDGEEAEEDDGAEEGAEFEEELEAEVTNDDDGAEEEVFADDDGGDGSAAEDGDGDEGEGDEEEEEEEDEAEVNYKVWDGTLNASVFFSSAGNTELGVRSLANYLEYVIRRDDPDFEPVVEEGVFNTIKEYLDSLAANSLSPLDAAALPRLSANLERLKEYDPAFAPDNEFDENEDPEEEIDEEILNEEDAYLAEMMMDEEDEEIEEDGEEDEDSLDDEDDSEDDSGDEVDDDELEEEPDDEGEDLDEDDDEDGDDGNN